MTRPRFHKPRFSKPTVSTALAVLIAGGAVAFALLQSQAKLTGNSIQTQTAGLVISQNGTNYGPSAAGYNFSGIIPGAQLSQTEHIVLKNTGTSPLALRLGIASTPANPSGTDLSKVQVVLTPYSTTTYMPGTPQSFSLQSLIDAEADGGTSVVYPASLPTGSTEEFNIQMGMDAGAMNGSSATLSNIDLAFTGTAVSSTD